MKVKNTGKIRFEFVQNLFLFFPTLVTVNQHRPQTLFTLFLHYKLCILKKRITVFPMADFIIN